MSHPNKAKGTRFEREVADTCADFWPTADRKALHGAHDHGDIVNVPHWTLECKNEKTLRLSEYMTEAEKEASNAKTGYFAAIVKRRGKGVEESYVVMPFWLWLSVAAVMEAGMSAIATPRQESQQHVLAGDSAHGTSASAG